MRAGLSAPTDAAGVWHGFVYKNGQFGSPIDAPGANGVTFALGINGIGPIGGSYVGTDGNVHGFLDIAGAFTPIDFPGADVTYPFSVNNNVKSWAGRGPWPELAGLLPKHR